MSRVRELLAILLAENTHAASLLTVARDLADMRSQAEDLGIDIGLIDRAEQERWREEKRLAPQLVAQLETLALMVSCEREA